MHTTTGAPTDSAPSSRTTGAGGTGLRTSTGPAEALRVDGLRRTYGDTVAVDDVCFTVPAGHVVGLVGANGAGKTTTISCVAGLQHADTGEVAICGVPVSSDRIDGPGPDLGLAGQEVSLYPELSARINLEFFAELLGLSPAEIRASIAELSQRLDLEPLLDTKVRFLSGGQRQLIHVATALVHHPRLVLLDEPSTGLDPRARADMLQAIQWTAGRGAGVLFSSHRLTEVEEVCDEVIVLHHGRVVAAGPLHEVVARNGEPHVEIRRRGGTETRPGTDVAAALAEAGDLSDIEGVAVVQPSLESVFFSLTGIDLAHGAEEES